jgi:hypothetical protein
MIAAIVVAGIVVALVVGLLAGRRLTVRGGSRQRTGGPPVRHILLPFAGLAISRRAVDAALRLARAENAVLMPAFLARVPMTLPIDAPVPQQCSAAMPVLEAIERRAHARGVQVDARIGRGRSYRDALRRLLASERFDRVVVPAGAMGTPGLTGDDLVWLLDRAPAEVVIVRPDPEDRLTLTGAGVPGL